MLLKMKRGATSITTSGSVSVKRPNFLLPTAGPATGAAAAATSVSICHVTWAARVLTAAEATAIVFVIACGSPLRGQTGSPSDPDGGWVSLFNGKNFDGWYTFLPSTGKNADPKNIFKVENGMVHILDIPVSRDNREFGYLATDREFGHCRIRAAFKWGAKRFPPREDDKRDSGLLYYVTGPDKVWPRALELQIQETDVGDLLVLEGTRITTQTETDGHPTYVLSGQSMTQQGPGRIIKSGDFEDRSGWNTVEVILDGDRITHLVNGRAVMRAWDIKQKPSNGPAKYSPVTSGRILLQAEGAEIWFRDVRMKPLDRPR